jgi:hypothetical protein
VVVVHEEEAFVNEVAWSYWENQPRMMKEETQGVDF